MVKILHKNEKMGSGHLLGLYRMRLGTRALFLKKWASGRVLIKKTWAHPGIEVERPNAPGQMEKIRVFMYLNPVTSPLVFVDG